MGKDKIEWEDFISQHDGLQLIMETYNVSVEQIKEVMVTGISDLIRLKQISKKLGDIK